MTPVATAKSDAPPGDPIRAALDDPRVRNELANHAHAVIVHWRSGRLTGERDTHVEDALQETITRALQLGHTFDLGTGTVPAWLHGILTNVLREMARTLGRQRVQLPAESGGWESLAADLALPADTVATRLDAASYLSRLSEDHQTILRLRYWDDLSAEEIAGRLGISITNARVRLCRALRALKDVAGVNREEDVR
jgi:RNA polymerase sigma factor (sigma-70 family)